MFPSSFGDMLHDNSAKQLLYDRISTALPWQGMLQDSTSTMWFPANGAKPHSEIMGSKKMQDNVPKPVS
jgi:hypothetical protein